MAKIESGLLSTMISGKLGGKVFCRHPKTPYVRSMPTKTTKKPSEVQVFRRNGFKVISALIKPLADLLKLHFQGEWLNMGLKVNLSLAVIQNGTEAKIDYRKIRFTQGGSSRIDVLETVLLKSGELLVEWQFAQYFSRANEVAVILVYCPGMDLWHYSITNYSIDDCLAGMIVPDHLRDRELHGYMYFLDRQSRAVSDTLYLGKFSNNP